MRAHLPVIGIAIAFAACAHKTPEQKLAGDLDPASSWIATLDFASETWLGNRVPAAFMRDTISAAQKAIETARKSAEQSKANAGMRGAVRDQLRNAAAAAAELNGAINRGDRAAVARAKSRFAASYAALHEIQQREQP